MSDIREATLWALRQAIEDPGAVTARRKEEHLAWWQVRAVLTVAARYVHPLRWNDGRHPDTFHAGVRRAYLELLALVDGTASEQDDQADALARHRREWASYIENWDCKVGVPTPTVRDIVIALRQPEPPFGRAEGRP